MSKRFTMEAKSKLPTAYKTSGKSSLHLDTHDDEEEKASYRTNKQDGGFEMNWWEFRMGVKKNRQFTSTSFIGSRAMSSEAS